MENKKTKKNILLKVKNFYSNNSLLFNCIILSGFFMANCFLPFFSFITYGFALICVLFDKLKKGFSYLLFTVPFVCMHLPLSPILFAVVGLTFIIKLLIIKIKNNKESFKVNWLLIVLYLLFVVYCFVPINGPYNLVRFYKSGCLAILLLFIYAMIIFPEEFNLRFNFKVLLFAMFVSSGISLLRPYSSLLQQNVYIYQIEEYFRFSGLFSNPNTFALVCDLGVCFMGYYLVSKNPKFTDGLTFIGFSVLGILTFSKTFMIICTINTIIIFARAIFSRSKILASCCLLYLLMVTGFVVFAPGYINLYLERFMVDLSQNPEAVMNSITTERFNLWVKYFNYIISNPIVLIVGCGLGAPMLGPLSSHNLYIAALYQLGIVGSVIFLALVITLFVSAFKKAGTKVSVAVIIPTFSIMLIGLIEDLMFYLF